MQKTVVLKRFLQNSIKDLMEKIFFIPFLIDIFENLNFNFFVVTFNFVCKKVPTTDEHVSKNAMAISNKKTFLNKYVATNVIPPFDEMSIS